MTLIDGRRAVCLLGMIALFTPALCRAQGYTISTVAGGGPVGSAGCAQATDYLGDGCSATSASLGIPYGVGVDAAGNLYIADTGDRVIRKVSPSGTISTVAGTPGGFGYWAMAAPRPAPNLVSPGKWPSTPREIST